MKRYILTPQYILSALLMLLIAAAASFAGVITIYSERVDSEILRINNETLRYNYDMLELKAEALDTAAAALNITSADKNTAMTAILRYADLLNERYGALIVDNPRDLNGVLSVSMLMSFIPADSADFLNTLNTLVNKENPAVFINELSVELSDTFRGVYTVRIYMDLLNPYTGETK